MLSPPSLQTVFLFCLFFRQLSHLLFFCLGVKYDVEEQNKLIKEIFFNVSFTKTLVDHSLCLSKSKIILPDKSRPSSETFFHTQVNDLKHSNLQKIAKVNSPL